MLTRIKKKVKALIGSEHIVRGMFVASMLESTIVPIPLEAALLPLMQVRRDKIWALATAATLGCIVGALFGYALGYFLFELIEPWLVSNFTSQEVLDQAITEMRAQGFYFTLTLGIVPIPFQIAMIVAGATSFSISLFILATAISRAIRYYGIAIAVYYGGNHAERIIKQHKLKVIIFLLVMIAIAWWFGLRP